MQIHELNRPRRTNEGAGWDAIKTSVSNAVADATGQDRQANAASAGILDPKQKLAAVMREPQMVKLATQYADEWVKKQAQAVPEAEAVAAPGTYNKKTGAAKLGGKTMTALSDLPPAVQQQIQAKQQELEKQTGQPNPSTVPTKPAAGTPAPNTINAPGFNYNNVMKMPGMEKYATPATATNTSAQTPPATGSQVNKAKPDNPNIKDQTRYVQGRAGSGASGDATKFAKFDPATSAVANAGQGINNMVRGSVAAQQPAAPAKATGTAMPLKPFQVPGAGTNPNPTKPGQPATTTTTPAKTTGTAMPLKPFQVPGAGTDPNPTKPAGYKAATATPSAYVTDFLKWANEKVAMRDSATYKMLGLTAAENSDLKAELDAARQEVISAQGNPAATKTAVKNYILTALAALQLVSSQNTVKAASPEAPAYGQQPTPAGQSGKTGAAASNSTAPTPATGQLTGSNAVALLNKAGLTAQVLGKAGEAIQKNTGNKQLSTSGDSVIDTMLEGMGYTVS
jgi:hypothetical protein